MPVGPPDTPSTPYIRKIGGLLFLPGKGLKEISRSLYRNAPPGYPLPRRHLPPDLCLGQGQEQTRVRYPGNRAHVCGLGDAHGLGGRSHGRDAGGDGVGESVARFRFHCVNESHVIYKKKPGQNEVCLKKFICAHESYAFAGAPPFWLYPASTSPTQLSI